MAKKKNRARLLWMCLVGFLIGGFLAVVIELTWGNLLNDPERILPLAHKAYDHGVAALEAGDGNQAYVECDRAVVQARKALESLNAAMEQPEAQDPNQAQKLQNLTGEAC
jgi:hypothetical protein